MSAMRSTMHKVEQDANLNHRLEVRGDDEIGTLSQAFNSTLDKFSGSLREVCSTPPTGPKGWPARSRQNPAQTAAQAAEQQRR